MVSAPVLAVAFWTSVLNTVSAQSITCPSSNGATYTNANGATFTIECGIDHAGGDYASASTNTFQQCIDLCASYAWCVDVSYSGVGCYMKNTVGKASNNGVSGARLLSSGSTSSSAASSTSTSIIPSTSSTSSIQATSVTTTMATSTSASTAPPSCPASNGATYVSGSSSFIIECSVDRAGGDLSMVYTSSFVACMAACSSTSGCIDVSWVPGSPQGPCYMKSTAAAGQANSNVWGARVLSTSVSTSASTSKSSSTTSSVSRATPTTLSTITTSSTSTSSASTHVNAPTNVPGCGKALPSGQSPGGSSTTVSFTQSDGTQRSYLIWIPPNYSSNTQSPLMVSYHGAGASSGNQEAITGFSTTAVNTNYIIVYPQGVNVSSPF